LPGLEQSVRHDQKIAIGRTSFFAKTLIMWAVTTSVAVKQKIQKCVDFAADGLGRNGASVAAPA
jgi:hypothetical protein